MFTISSGAAISSFPHLLSCAAGRGVASLMIRTACVLVLCNAVGALLIPARRPLHGGALRGCRPVLQASAENGDELTPDSSDLSVDALAAAFNARVAEEGGAQQFKIKTAISGSANGLKSGVTKVISTAKRVGRAVVNAQVWQKVVGLLVTARIGRSAYARHRRRNFFESKFGDGGDSGSGKNSDHGGEAGGSGVGGVEGGGGEGGGGEGGGGEGGGSGGGSGEGGDGEGGGGEGGGGRGGGGEGGGGEGGGGERTGGRGGGGRGGGGGKGGSGGGGSG